ncbi:hypothetical protein NQ317_013801 [Molorchus minor]|uniref:Telomere length regulation protein conserved domain-containing protein n=1 Tax=Molorchus minor TaxID=1323400 RepID=A0ABQ9J3Z6_9CUCU|nr:hypothetical protein NQ317_013801 [Molorchus minor]
MINELQSLYDTNLQELYKLKTDFNTNAADLLKVLLITDLKEVEYIPPDRRIRNKICPPANNEVLIINATKPKIDYIKIIDNTNFELDSDDDLEPYDLSNDVKVTKKNPPAYLRDLRDGLLEMEDYEIFTLSLENCEKLIVSQLSDDDATIGLELLEILLSLEPKFYVENFDSLIHADLGTYSIARRIFMLDVLRQAARTLSDLKKSDKPESHLTKKDTKTEQCRGETLAVIMGAAENCLIAPRMAKEIFHFSWFLRFHNDVKVRMGVLTLISSAILNVPETILIQDSINELFEIRLWLADLLNPVRGEPNLECRSLAACAMILIEGILKVELYKTFENPPAPLYTVKYPNRPVGMYKKRAHKLKETPFSFILSVTVGGGINEHNQMCRE